ncbi:MAG: glycosyltransferase [Acidobacteria bacterium]|nr:MAG: glycosyltransferase [Acidobacteriota bacterium]
MDIAVEPTEVSADQALVSIVVPVLDERDSLPRCLASLSGQQPPCEVLVVDGGSTDGTRALAASTQGVRVVDAPPGRASQMNAGARAARGALLWFLHADCTAPPGAVAALRRTLADPRVALAAFRFAIDGDRPAYRLIERGVALRCRLLRLPYGDQGLALRRATFERIGGFEDVPLFEDVRLVRAARRLGRLALLPLALPTSPRRWERTGMLRLTVLHLRLALLERLGVPPARLAARRAQGTR